MFFLAKNLTFAGKFSVGHYSVIGIKKPGADSQIIIGDGCDIGSYAIIENNVFIGANFHMDHRCCIYDGTVVGDNVRLLYKATIYSDCRIGNGCIICNDLPERVFLHDRVTFMGRIAHSYRDATLPWDSTIEPSPVIGEGTVIGEQALIIGDITIGDNCYVGAGETLRYDLPSNSVFLKNEIYPIEYFKGLIKTRYFE